MLDTDGSGELNEKELAAGMEVLGLNFSEDELHDIFMEMDADGSGSVDFEELLRYARMNREVFQILIGTGNRHTKGTGGWSAWVDSN